MPKSKKRKMKYTPKPRVAQQPVTTTTQPIGLASKPMQAAAPLTTVTKAKPMAGKAQAIPQPTNISTELKVMGAFTFVLLIAIVALYFVFR